jgi:hypothetical protein
MPVYCYESDDGDVVERFYKVGQAPHKVEVRGVKYRRSFAAEGVGVPVQKGWPIECVASGVNASQAGELREHFRKAGVPTEVSADGNPIYRDARHRRKALKCRGLFDKSSFN